MSGQKETKKLKNNQRNFAERNCMERVYFTEYKGKKFLYIDMSKCSAEEMLAVIANAGEIIGNQPEKSVFSLTDVTDAWFDPDVTDAMKEFLFGNKPYVVAAAVVGVTGSKIMKILGRKLVLFDTIEQAKEWLVDRIENPAYYNETR
jgi:hypothetical protein